MRKLRAYIDTSVLGGCFDDEFKEDSLKLMEYFKKEKWIAVISDTTSDELEGASQDVRDILKTIPEESIENVQADEEAKALATEYVKANIVRKNSFNDALHVAMATCAGANIILSWNFKDMVNKFRIQGFNSVNLRLGYSPIDIRSPKEVIYGEEI